MSLKRQIDRCIAAKQGNKEFALFCKDGVWTAMIGNPMLSIRLGETEGEIVAHGATATAAVVSLLQGIAAYVPPPSDEERAVADLKQWGALDVDF